MAHNLEVNDGKVAFALRGEPAWHGLANAIFDQNADITTAEMLKSAYLADWNIQLEKVEFPHRSTTDNFMVVRTNPFDGEKDILAVVGDRYNPYQNEQLFAFGDSLTDGGAKWESAGSIKDGKVVFGSMVVPKEFILDPKGVADKTTTYLLITTSHDGSSSIQAMITPVRVVCQNTLNMALNGSKQSFKVRHTQKSEARVDEARRVLGLTFDHMDRFEDLAKHLFATPITNKGFDKLFETLYPAPDQASKGAFTRYTNKADFTKALYLNSPTQEGITGTAWGALNALTERIDWFRDGNTRTEGLMASASGFEVGVNAEKARILSAVKEFAGMQQ